jgi:hypothetical protein
MTEAWNNETIQRTMRTLELARAGLMIMERISASGLETFQLSLSGNYKLALS